MSAECELEFRLYLVLDLDHAAHHFDGLDSESRLPESLAAGDLGNRISEIISDLRAKYPSVGSDELVNYLMTAYCPVVNGLSGLSDDEKEARLDAFSSQVLAVATQP